jgi:hypothetical protein
MRKQLTLTPGEISFLQWLSDNGGIGSRSGNNWIGTTERLVRFGYVEIQLDKLRANTVHYRLTENGLEVFSRRNRITVEKVSKE